MPPKKNKEVTLSLSEFSSGFDTGMSWADDEGDTMPSFQTITAPAAAVGASDGGWVSGGGFSTGESAPIPDVPPFTARIGNLSYSITEDDLEAFFAGEHGLRIESLRLPRGPDGRVRGSAYIDFTSRDDLVKALGLSGTQIQGRSIMASVPDQRSSGAPGGFGHAEFDWSKRVDPGAAVGGESRGFGGAGGDRLDRFRRGPPRDAEPDLDWGKRTGPLPPASGFGGPRRSLDPEADLDWTKRTGPLPPSRGPPAPESTMDWTKRTGPLPPARAPRKPEPELDWGKRTGPLPPARKPRAREPELDWGAKRTGPLPPPGNRRNSGGAWGASRQKAPRDTERSLAPLAAPAQPSAEEKQKKGESARIAKLQKGFKALDLDDEADTEQQDKQTVDAPPKAPQQPVESIAAIQEQQRDANSGNWSQA